MSNTAYRLLEPDKQNAEIALVITCEHASNQVPAAYRNLFVNCRAILASHRGFDPGAQVMAKAMGIHFGAPLLSAVTSRLLVDLNRSLGHRHLHMDSVRQLPAGIRQDIIEHYYLPYRKEAERLIKQQIAQRGKVVHLSCHSFTHTLNGVVRHADIGLLYDPARSGERTLCASWQAAIKASAPCLAVRRNFPYQGRNDGLTTALRKDFPPEAYLGIELELNQKNLAPAQHWAALQKTITTTLATVLRGYIS
ncbi:N-formylglutamate amidohydrolase [Halopseudomonas salegens]|uniref:Predicted N-formylglutamate amidohydrolase n=1 Tax=Halopseudomonas salegens TaxID=1434072 RepID=A0A1H2GTV3_9GAMM|nr:N-formylglutamate amidohydrolase [Halopseudomonas salegens]SDU22912.1 Predicted N-formylglutamate amidohydrolase [Halopseudomonas salegens]